jgi:hypothetical protein
MWAIFMLADDLYEVSRQGANGWEVDGEFDSLEDAKERQRELEEAADADPDGE